MAKKKILKIKNLTPHGVRIINKDGKVAITFPSEGSLRLSSTRVRESTLTLSDGVEIPITKTSFGGIDSLPPKEEGTIYIVSSLVCQACPDRPDFYIPDDTIRDENGVIIGCRSLSRNPWYVGGSNNGGDEE